MAKKVKKPKVLESNLRKVGDPFGVVFTTTFKEYIGYYDVGIGAVDFSLSVFVRDTGGAEAEVFYGDLSLGKVGHMQGLAGFSASVTTAGNYYTNPGPYLTVLVRGEPINGNSNVEVTIVLRVENFEEPDSYHQVTTSRPPWMQFFTPAPFRSSSSVSELPPTPSCDNETIQTTVPPTWSPYYGEGSEVTTSVTVPTTRFPEMTTLQPTYPPSYRVPNNPPPSLPTAEDGVLSYEKGFVYSWNDNSLMETEFSVENFEFSSYSGSPFLVIEGNPEITGSSIAAVKDIENNGSGSKFYTDLDLAYFNFNFSSDTGP